MDENEDLRNISEPAVEQEAECMDEMEDLRNILISIEIKISELEDEIHKKEIEYAAILHRNGRILQQLDPLINKMMTLELHIDMDLDTSIALGMTEDVTLNFLIIGSDMIGMVMNETFWYRYLFDRGR